MIKNVKWTDVVQSIGLLVTLFYLIKGQADTKSQISSLKSLSEESLKQSAYLYEQLVLLKTSNYFQSQQSNILKKEYLLKIRPVLSIERAFRSKEEWDIQFITLEGMLLVSKLAVPIKGKVGKYLWKIALLIPINQSILKF
ncbi:MAG: hypothetical protein IPM92_03425 [Saprospiraceae bacterium]|nr:hypothetical protein [Saprospiraceae bacterium]